MTEQEIINNDTLQATKKTCVKYISIIRYDAIKLRWLI